MDINRLIKDYRNNLKRRKTPIKLNKTEKTLLILLLIFGVTTIAAITILIFTITTSKLFMLFFLISLTLLIVIALLIAIYSNYQSKNNKLALTKLKHQHKNKKILSVLEALKNQNIDLKNKNVMLTVYNNLNFKSIKNTSIYSLFWDCIKNLILPLLVSLVGIYAGLDATKGVITFFIVITFCIAFILAAIPITTSVYEIINKKRILLNEICDIIFEYIISENKCKNCKIKKIK